MFFKPGKIKEYSPRFLRLQQRITTTYQSVGSNFSTKLIIAHCKSGNVEAARKVFDEMLQRTVVSWSAIISGYTQNGRPEHALEIFNLMLKSECKPNQFTYGSVLRACGGAGCLRSAMQVHACAAKSMFGDDLFVQSAILDLQFKFGFVEDARCLFDRMELKDTVCWNSGIAGLAVCGLAVDALHLFRSMMRDGMLPDRFTLGSILKACGMIKILQNVMQVHTLLLKLGYGVSFVANRSLIDAYAKCSCMSSARLLYDAMQQPDLISCTALITGYAQEEKHSGEALKLFFEMIRKGKKFDDVILCSVLNACANLPCLSLGKQIHAKICKSQTDNDVALSNALIDVYAKCGEIKDAHQAFNAMRFKNVISWTSLISGYGRHGLGEKAVSLFHQMDGDGLEPNDVTFLSLLSACSHAGLTSIGLDFFNSMVHKYKIRPRQEHYSCVVDLLMRGGQVEEAFDFVKKLGVPLNSSLWGAMFGANRIHGNISRASHGNGSSKHLLAFNLDSSVNYVALANTYAAAGLWEDAQKIRKMMEDKDMKKNAGSSLVLLAKEVL